MRREQDHEKFKELAVKRMRRAIKDIRLVGNLANKSNYFYTEEDANKIIKALKAEISNIEMRFKKKGAENEIDFEL